MIHLPACDDEGLGSTTDQSISGIFGGQNVTGTDFPLPLPFHQHSMRTFHVCAVDTMLSLQLAASFN